MKLKSLMALAIALLCSAGAWAQTDVTSTYITNPSFEADGNTVAESNSANEFATEWTAVTFSDARHAIFNSSSTSADNVYGSSAPSDGTYYLFIRSYGSNSKTQNIQQKTAMPLPKGKYQVSFDYKAARTNNTGRTLTISAKNGSTTKGSKAIAIPKVNSSTNYFSTGGGKDWTTESFVFVLEETTDIKLDISCQTNQKTQVLLDNFVLNYFNINGDALAALIAQATSINMAQGGLSEAITTAQGVYDGIDNTPAYQATIDDAITTLKSAITTKVAGITMHHGDDLSYLIANAGFEGITAESESYSTAEGKDYSTDGWILDTTCDSGQGAVLTYDTGLTVNGAAIPENDNAGNSGKALGLSVGWGGTQLYKTAPITLPAGKYNFKVYGYNAGTSTTLTSKFGFAPTSGGAMLSTKTSYTKGEWGSEEVTIELAEPTEGCFQLGGVAVSGSGSGSTAKVFFDNITLTYINELAEAQEQWLDVHDALKDLDATALPDAAEVAITTELEKTVPTTTVDAVNEAKAALQALIDSYDGIKAAYTRVNGFIDDVTDVKDNSAGNKDDIETAISDASSDKEGCTDVDGLNGVYDALETARQTYVTSGAEPAAGYPFEVTFKIVNPSFEDDKKEISNPAGWTIPNRGNQYGAKAKGSMSNVEGNYYFNNWQSWWMDCNVEQTISSLPNGRYEVTAVLASYNGTSANLQAGSGSTDRDMTGENNGIRVSVNGDVTGSSLTIRARAGRKNDGSLLRADDFTLSFIGLKPVLSDLITSATALTTTNVGDGAFQIPLSAATTLSNAINTAQGVYDNGSAYGSSIQDAIDELNNAIETFQSVELNAPANNARYRIKSTAATGASWKDKYYMLRPDASQANGGYSTKADVSAADYLAIAWKFTAVTGGYTLSMTDADGATRYLCTNIKGYGEGSATQIRTTTDSEKALVVKVIAATGTDGRWFLQNTEDNSYLGGQDAGLFSNSQNYDLAIEEASEASVTVSCKAGKYGTVIFPFTPDVSTGFDNITFYSISTITDGSLALAEVADPVANTPYIIKNDDSNNFSKTLQGFGTAKQNEYTDAEELLTGFYTAQEIAAGNYVLQTQGGVQAFYKLANDATANQGYRAYLKASAANVKAFYFDFNDATAISETLAPTGRAGEGPIYNLAGQKMSKLQKGVNIVNGKKVLVK